MDDLLKLAKQFDFSMFRQAEEGEDLHQQSLELLPEDVLDFENGVSASPLRNSEVAGTDVQKGQQMEDDLDFLFDGPTQQVSGDLSQAPPPPTPFLRETSGKPASHGLASAASTTNSKATSANVEFEDDWDNDDLLNDSLVLEMTQNPQNFSAPQHSSTQKPPGEAPVKAPVSGGVRVDRVAGWTEEKQGLRQRTTFKLDTHCGLSKKATQTHTVSVPVASQRARLSNTQKTDPRFHQRTSVSSLVSSSSDSKLEAASSRPIPPADFPDEDLESFFSSEPVWDSLDDNDLCEVCEDVENQIQSMEKLSNKVPPPVSQRTVLQPSNRTWNSRNHQPPSGRGAASLPHKQTPPCAPGTSSGSSLPGVSVFNAAAATQAKSFRYTQTKNYLGSGSTCLQGSSRSGPASARKDQFTFKRPKSPVSAVTSKGERAQ